jgi:hypothetical protein
MIPASSINCEVDFGGPDGVEMGVEGLSAAAALLDLLNVIVELVVVVMGRLKVLATRSLIAFIL